MTALHYDNYTDARNHFKDLLDAADQGRTATVRREDGRAAIVNADRLRYYLASLASKAVVVHEAGSWWVYLPGLPIYADGGTFDEAIDEMVYELRDYAEDWHDHLATAPNHENNWGLVQLVELSSDDQLKEWLRGTAS